MNKTLKFKNFLLEGMESSIKKWENYFKNYIEQNNIPIPNKSVQEVTVDLIKIFDFTEGDRISQLNSEISNIRAQTEEIKQKLEFAQFSDSNERENIQRIHQDLISKRKQLFKEINLLFEKNKLTVNNKLTEIVGPFASKFKSSLEDKDLFYVKEEFIKSLLNIWLDYFAAEPYLDDPDYKISATIISFIMNRVSDLLSIIDNKFKFTQRDPFQQEQSPEDIINSASDEERDIAQKLSGNLLDKNTQNFIGQEIASTLFSNVDVSADSLIESGYPELANLVTKEAVQLSQNIIKNVKQFEKIITFNSAKIQELLLAFKRKTDLNYQNSSEELQDLRAEFKKHNLESLDQEDKDLFAQIPKDQNPFEEVDKFNSLFTGTPIHESGLAFMMLFHLTNGGNKPINTLSSAYKSEEFVDSDWYKTLYQKAAKETTTLGKPKVQDIIQIRKFLTSFYKQEEGKISPSERLRTSLGDKDFAQKLFEPLIRFKILAKDATEHKDLERALQIKNGPQKEAKKRIYETLLPILGDYMLERYTDDTLGQSNEFKVKLIGIFDKAIDKYNPEKNPNLMEYFYQKFEDYRLGVVRDRSGKAKFSKKPLGDKYYSAAKRIYANPTSPEDIKDLFNKYIQAVSVQKINHYQGDSYRYKILHELESQEEDSVIGASDLRSKKIKREPHKVFFGMKPEKPPLVTYVKDPKNPDAPAKRTIIKSKPEPKWASLNTKPDTTLLYASFPKDSLIKDPNSVRQYVSTMFDNMIASFVKELTKLKEGKSEEKSTTKVVEPVSGKDKGKVKTDETAFSRERQNILMKLLYHASGILKVINISEKDFIDRMEKDVEGLLSKDSGNKEKMREILQMVYRGDFKGIQGKLFQGKDTARNIEKREEARNAYEALLPKIISMASSIIKQELPKIEERMNSMTEEELGTSYINVVDDIKERLIGALLPLIARVQTDKAYVDANGNMQKGRSSAFPINTDGTTSILNTKLKDRYEKLGKEAYRTMGTAVDYKNTDASSDSRQTAFEVLMYVINRYAYKLQNGEEHYGDNFIEKISSELDSELKKKYNRDRNALQFGTSQFSHGALDDYYRSIFYQLNKDVVAQGFQFNDSRWFEEHEGLKNRALHIFMSRLKTKYPEFKEINPYEEEISAKEQKDPAKLRFMRYKNDFVSWFPSYLKERGAKTLSLDYESTSEDGEASSLGDSISSDSATYANDPTILFEILRGLEDTLKYKCFAPIKSGLDLDDNQIRLINGLLKQIKIDINDNPELANKIVDSVTDNLSNPMLKRVIAYKYFEYLYIREILMAKYFIKLTEYMDNKDVSANEAAKTVEKYFQGTLHKPELIQFENFNEDNLNINYLFKTYLYDYRSYMDKEMISLIIAYLSNNSDMAGDASVKFNPIKQGSDTQGNVKGGDVSASSKTEDSSVNRIDKEKLLGLSFATPFRDIQDKLSKDLFALNKGKEVKGSSSEDMFIQAVSSIKNIVRNSTEQFIEQMPDEKRIEFLSTLKSDIKDIFNYLPSDEDFKLVDDKIQKDLIKLRDGILKFTSTGRDELRDTIKKCKHIINTLYQYNVLTRSTEGQTKEKEAAIINSAGNWIDETISEFNSIIDMNEDEISKQNIKNINNRINTAIKSTLDNMKKFGIKNEKLFQKSNLKSTAEIDENLRQLLSRYIQYLEKIRPLATKKTTNESIIIESINYELWKKLFSVMQNVDNINVKKISSLILKKLAPEQYLKLTSLISKIKPQMFDSFEIYNQNNFKDIVIVQREESNPEDFMTWIVPKSSLSIN